MAKYRYPLASSPNRGAISLIRAGMVAALKAKLPASIRSLIVSRSPIARGSFLSALRGNPTNSAKI